MTRLATVVAIIGAAGGYLTAMRDPPVYESTARILIVAPEAADGPAEDQTDPAESLGSAGTCQLAVVDDAIRKLACLRHAADPALALQSMLHVAPLTAQGDIVEVRFSAERQNEPQAVLFAIIKAYRSASGELLQDEAAAALRGLEELRDRIHADLSQREKSYADWLAAAPWDRPSQEAAAVNRQRLSELENGRNYLQRQLEIAQYRAESSEVVQSVTRTSVSPAATPSPSIESVPKSRNSTGDHSLDELLAEERQLLTKFGPHHPRVLAVRARIDAASADTGVETAETKQRAEIIRLSAALGPAHPKVRQAQTKLAEITQQPEAEIVAATPRRENTASTLPSTPEIVVSTPAADMPVVIQDLQSELSRIESQLTSLRRIVSEFNEWEARDRQWRDEIDRLQRMFDAAVARYRYLNAPKQPPLKRAFVLQAPKPAVAVHRPVGVPVMAGTTIGLLIGLVLSGMQSYAATFAPRRGELNVLTQIPQLPPIKAVEHPRLIGASLIVVDKPNSPQAEAFRQLRVAVQFCNGDEPHLVLMCFATQANSASAAAVLNLSASLALAGSRTLTIDATRNGVARRLWGLSPSQTLQHVMDGNAELIDATATTDVTHLHVGIWTEQSEANATSVVSLSNLSMLGTKYDKVVLFADAEDGALMQRCCDDAAVLLFGCEDDLSTQYVEWSRTHPALKTRWLGAVVLRQHAGSLPFVSTET
jgi:hypothetical protein